jgi:predicted DNA-binding transcriptional regulator AlpA
MEKAPGNVATTIWFTAAELADRFRMAQSTLWQWHLRGYGPPAVRIGGKLRYRREAVEQWEREQEALSGTGAA